MVIGAFINYFVVQLFCMACIFIDSFIQFLNIQPHKLCNYLSFVQYHTMWNFGNLKTFTKLNIIDQINIRQTNLLLITCSLPQPLMHQSRGDRPLRNKQQTNRLIMLRLEFLQAFLAEDFCESFETNMSDDVVHFYYEFDYYIYIDIYYINIMLGLYIFLVCVFFFGGRATDNGLGLTPPMGWNSWNHFGCNINEDLIKKTADLLVSTGLADKGYKYLNLDDCWQIARDNQTHEIIEDKNKFPSGMKTLSKYVHDKGLLFGLYSDAGQKTCQGRPGGYTFQKIDAKTYAAWDVDYLKYDNCYNLNISGRLRYLAMHNALNQSGKHIFYSMCNWGQQNSWEWAGPYANSWRTTGDISDKWDSFVKILDKQNGLQSYAGKGGWNDPDMLEVGNGGMTFNEYYAHFALWCILKAPLLIGCSLQKISEETLEILGNQELIAVNQDGLGKQGRRLKSSVGVTSHIQVWGGPLSNNRWVLAFFNRGQKQQNISIKLSDLQIKYDNYSIRDIIKHQDEGIKTDDQIIRKVAVHSISVIVLKFYESKQLQAQ